MDGRHLNNSIKELGISQAEFAGLIDVTPRAVTLWISGERSIPGSVESYLRVLHALPPYLRHLELSHIKRRLEMRDGIYTIEYQYEKNFGVATLVFDRGQIFGIDVGVASYDGEYTYDVLTRLANATVKITFPKNGMTVFGIQHPFEWSIDVTAKFDPHADIGEMTVQTSLGPQLTAKYKFARSLPRAA